MQFAFTDEQAMIAETVRTFFAGRASSDQTRRAMDVGQGCDSALWQAFAGDLALAGVALPEAAGGAGLGMVELAIVAEAAGYHVAALPLVASMGLAMPAILAGGSDAQREKWLPRLAGGDVIGTAALTGDEGDPDRPGVRLRGGRLTGTAHFVPHGGCAHLFVVAVEGGAVLVERASAGLAVTHQTSMDLTRPHARLDFDDVAGDVLADGPAAIAAALRCGWIALAADALGGAQACLDRTVAYVKERVQFGRTIGSFQAVKHRLADMMVEVEQARSAVYWAACAADEGAGDARFAAHAAKAFAAEAYRFAAGNMIQLHGGIGFTWEHDAHLYFKRAQADASLLGAPAWHRERIARISGLDAPLLEGAA